MIGKTYTKIKLLLLVTGVAFSAACKQTGTINTMNPSGFEISRGVNLSHWLSQDFGWEPKYTYIDEKDIRFIDSIGYDHVRIPIDEEEMWDPAGKPIEMAFSYLTSCLGWCAKYDLRAIVDLHILRSHYFNAPNEGGTNTLWTDSAAQQHVIDLWLQISERFHNFPVDMVAYEVLNEPVAPDHEDWNKLLGKTIAALRKAEPERVIVAGANMWQRPENIPLLKLPEGDRNIILSFHTYTPMALTHFEAVWTPVKYYRGPVHYPGQIITNEDYNKYVDITNDALVAQLKDARDTFNVGRLIEDFGMAVELAREKNLQLYCGEFGCMPTIGREDRLRYYADLIEALERNNVSWCNWEYKGEFGIYHFDMERKVSLEPDLELISVLLNGKEYRTPILKKRTQVKPNSR